MINPSTHRGFHHEQNILRLDSSVFGEQGQSTRLNNLVVEGLQARWPEANLIQRNLSELPHLEASFLLPWALTPQAAPPSKRTR